MKSLKQCAEKICRILKTTYPDVKTQLTHRNPFELLVATILSAQCTDRQVNSVTPALFENFSSPRAFSEAPLTKIENLIRPTGYFRNKAKHIKNCAIALIRDFNSQVPESIEELTSLPGVGRKTANVVRSACFNQPAIVVDTHVSRISQRLELTASRDPVKIEFDLMDVIERENWSDFSLHLIYFGRDICKARKPECPRCPLSQLCPYPDKTPPPSV